MSKRPPLRRSPARRGQRIASHALLIACAFVLLIFPLFSRLASARAPALRVWFFDVGQGDATLIETPLGRQVLVDGGPDRTILQKLPQTMWPWDRTLDAVVITHPDADHITGLTSVLEQYDVAAIYETGVRGGTPMIAGLVSAMATEGARMKPVRAGQSFEMDGVIFDVLWPTEAFLQKERDRNNTSVVLRVRYGSTTLLLTGDAEESVEAVMARSAGDVDVLKVGHHGSRTSTTAKFLQAVTPEEVVISAGEDNRYGHPHPIVLARLREAGARVSRTDQDGDLLLVSDGASYSLTPAFLPF
ncbi:MBL fold metallo-hydrolase [Candidatus Parcubacteria bacterium]|nr:MBL fold metallo-hydrolase [Candidatus Parcubacteria bacterium]